MNFNVIYDGKALESNEFDARDLSISLLSIHDLLNEANLILNQDRCDIKVKVKASFKTGSFEIDFKIIQNIYDKLFQYVLKPIAILEAIKGCVKLIKWLKGQTPDKIIENEDGTFSVYKSNKYIKCEKKELDLYQNYKIKKEFEKILRPLDNEGVSTFVLKSKTDQDEKFVEIAEEECNYFKVNKGEDLIGENEITKNLSIVSLSFKEGNRWKVTDGSDVFSVTIRDSTFLDDINNDKVSFRKNDIIKVRLLEKQYIANGVLKKESIIEKIIEHQKKPIEKKLDL